MKNYLLAVAMNLALVSSVSPARATGSHCVTCSTQIVHSKAHLTIFRMLNASHHIELKIGCSALSQLEIDVPEGIDIPQRIEITERSGQKVNATVSVSDKKIMMTFAQPVPPQTTLSFLLKGIKTSDYVDRTWFYTLSGRNVGTSTYIPFGIAQIQSYK